MGIAGNAVGRYDIIAEVARGDLGTVFLGRLGDHRLVSIKKLPRLTAASWDTDAPLDLIGLNHPNVISTLEVTSDHVVMEHVEGIALDAVLGDARRRHVAVPARVAVCIILDTLSGLHALHELCDRAGRPRGLVHGYVVPFNVIVGLDGTARIGQLAVSRGRAYAAPERTTMTVDRRADIFSVGAMLRECLDRRATPPARDGEPRRSFALDGLEGIVHPALIRVCARALERDPRARYQTAAAFRDELIAAAREANALGTNTDVAEFVDDELGTEPADLGNDVHAVDVAMSRFASGTGAPPTLDAAPITTTVHASGRAARSPAGTRNPLDERAVTASLPLAHAIKRSEAPEGAVARPSLPPNVTTPPPLPERFGKYVVTSHLASGGMAEVYLARATGIEGFEKLVVIKCLKPDQARSELATRMFLQEARIAATLEHPQIAQVYDAGEFAGSYFFAMEYVQGKDLRQIMVAASQLRRQIRLADSLRVVTELCGALHYAHEKRGSDGEPLGLVHRDVSPSNVLVSFDGSVKLCDFGVAEVAAARKDPKDRTLAGKRSYMSPEQLRGDPLDCRSDIFVLSIVLYELTTLTKAFAGKGDREVAQQILAGTIARPSSIRPDYPPELERIVMKGLSLEPGDRYPTAQAMRLDLEAFGRERKLAVSAVGLSTLLAFLFRDDTGEVIEIESQFGGAAVALRRPRPWYRAWLAIAAVAAGAAIASIPVESARKAPDRQLALDVQASGDRIAGLLAAELRATRTRAESIATTPMLRAAITTDTRTMADMVARESLFKVGAGEVFEFFRWGTTQARSVLRLPADAAAVSPLHGGDSRLIAGPDAIRVIASARLDPLYDKKSEGSLMISRPLTAATLAHELPEGVVAASLRGLDREVPLRGVIAADAPTIIVPLRLDRETQLTGLSIAASLPTPTTSWLATARTAALAFALAGLALYGIGRRRYRPWRKRS